MENPFSPGDRVRVQSNHEQHGMVGTVTAIGPEGDTILVKIDGESLSWKWHWSHFEAYGEPVTNFLLWQ